MFTESNIRLFVVVFQVVTNMTDAWNRKKAGCVAFLLGTSFLVLCYHGGTYLVNVHISHHKTRKVVVDVTEQSVLLSPTLAHVTPTYEDFLRRCKKMDIRAFRKTKSSVIYSRITGITKDNSDMNTVYIHIQTFDQQNRSKTVGGDLLHVIVTSDHVDGRVGGHVTDHGDGRYTGVVRLLWTDKVHIHVQIGSVLENVCLRLQATEKFGNQVFTKEKGWGIRGFYRGNIWAPCGANAFICGYNTTCNFTEINDNMSWYCGKPRDTNLQCSDIRAFKTGPFDVSAATQFEKIILPTVETLQDSVTLTHNVDTAYKHLSNTSLEKCSRRSSVYSWREGMDHPSGYWFNRTWIFYNCSSSIRHDPAIYRQCLKGKTLYFFGDSTVKQYAEFFLEKIMNLQKKNNNDFKGDNGDYHYRRALSGQGINLVYFKHAMPFHNPNFPPKGITSIPTELARLSESEIPGTDLIIFVSYHTHFQAYPISEFKDRILKLVSAVKHLLSVKPKTKVFFKGPHFIHDDIRWFDNRMSLFYRDIIHEAFSELASDVTYDVIYLDTWWVTVTHGNTDLHPRGDAFIGQIQQLMTYLC